MPESFQTILERYSRNQIANPRAVLENVFAPLAVQGSAAAAFSAGFIGRQVAAAEAQKGKLDAAFKSQQLALEGRRVAAAELNAQSLAELRDSQGNEIDTRTSLLPAETESLIAVREAQASGAISEAVGRQIQNGILSRFGDKQAQAEVLRTLGQANNAQASARATNATAGVTEATGVDVAQSTIRANNANAASTLQRARNDSQRVGIEAYNSQSQRINAQGNYFANINNAGANVQRANNDSQRVLTERVNAGSTRITANANAGLAGARSQNLQVTTGLDQVYGAGQRAASIYATNTGAQVQKQDSITRAGQLAVSQQNANTSQANSDTQRFTAKSNAAVAQSQQQQNAAFGKIDRQLQIARQRFNNEIQGQTFESDQQQRRFQILATQINALQSREQLLEEKNKLQESLETGVFESFFDNATLGFFRDEEKEQAVRDKIGLIDRQINLFDQALQ